MFVFSCLIFYFIVCTIENRWVLSLDINVERVSQFNTAGNSARVPSQRCGSVERSSGKWCPSKWHAQQWDGRQSSVACAGAQRDVLAEILRRWRLLSLQRQHGQLVVGSQCSVWSSELTSHRRGACRMIRAALFWTRWSFWIMLDAAQSYSSRVSRESGCMRAFMLSPASVNGACGGSRVHGNCTIALQLIRTSKLQRGVAVYVYSN